ncbi:hypothetical protein BOTBODRAFT_217285 [Botryobasidium botryosum FD-172 SS1]|uniref:Uncharacterized protein n=1 Tax=Botryobasidium botryosum (strain FD-172 SS1) TaxID=930990 RepID=A0A067N4N8_BOTB1|nr:hypothetical protein BOTBODRAFT_217285 [Botryobasidium botryosum FD-172 SS1]
MQTQRLDTAYATSNMNYIIRSMNPKYSPSRHPSSPRRQSRRLEPSQCSPSGAVAFSDPPLAGLAWAAHSSSALELRVRLVLAIVSEGLPAHRASIVTESAKQASGTRSDTPPPTGGVLAHARRTAAIGSVALLIATAAWPPPLFHPPHALFPLRPAARLRRPSKLVATTLMPSTMPPLLP